MMKSLARLTAGSMTEGLPMTSADKILMFLACRVKLLAAIYAQDRDVHLAPAGEVPGGEEGHQGQPVALGDEVGGEAVAAVVALKGTSVKLKDEVNSISYS